MNTPDSGLPRPFAEAWGSGERVDDLSLDRLARLCEQAASVLNSPSPSRERGAQGLIKRDRRVRMARVGGFVVKAWRDRSWLDRWRRRARHCARRAWNGGWSLERHGLSAPRVLAWLLPRGQLRDAGADALLVMDDLPPTAWELDRVLAELAHVEPPERARPALAALLNGLGRTLAQLRAAGLWHRDLKTCNLFVVMEQDAGGAGLSPHVGGALERWNVETRLKIGLLDLEDVIMPAQVTPAALTRAFAQLQGSLPHSVHEIAGAALPLGYSGGEAPPELRALWEKARHRARRRPIVYVARGSDVTEAWWR